ncbi:MAG: zinc/manganese transport system substrate-binding protein [Chloroflexota bacterium]|jgi:zinc/manganese transport system substrate-binding protein/manganese/iron transport system substrate-binding protein|nr:zinc/manganese transport system substrate-binding protein [Chloroflexota bacterium]
MKCRLVPTGLFALGLMVGLAACAGPSVPTGSRGLKVVTSTTVFADFVRVVGGSRIVVDSIIPAGVGPEDYEPKPDDARRLADADLVVKNGVGLDDFLDRLLAANSRATPLLTLGDGIPTITVDGQPNPHFWLDPTLVRDHYLPAIAAKLTGLDPAGAATYQANASAYARQLDDLDASLKARVQTVPPANRKLVTFHDAFPYFARHFGFEIVGVVLHNVGQEPTGSDLADLVRRVKAAGVKAVFSEAQFSPKLAQTLAQEAGITRIVTSLYNDALGPPPADTYLGMMSWNVDQVVAALK